MALPATNITTTLVGQELGLNTHNISQLCLSDKVNEYGFNSPDAWQQANYFGKTPTQRLLANQYVLHQSGYPLGVFRNYDHQWVCYTTESGSKTAGSTDLFSRVYIRMPIDLVKVGMINFPNPNVSHTFSVYYNTVNEWVHSGVKFITGQTASYPFFEFSINPQASPAGTALTSNQVVWFKVVHDSSPARRWVNGSDAVANNSDAECYIFPVTIPSDPYTYVMSYSDLTFFAYKSTVSGIIASLNIKGDLRVQNNSVNIKFEIASDSNFTTNKFMINASYTCNANTTSPGTSVQSGSAYFDLSSAISKFSVGSTIYYRVNFNNDGWSQTYSAIVSNQLPLD